MNMLTEPLMTQTRQHGCAKARFLAALDCAGVGVRAESVLDRTLRSAGAQTWRAAFGAWLHGPRPECALSCVRFPDETAIQRAFWDAALGEPARSAFMRAVNRARVSDGC